MTVEGLLAELRADAFRRALDPPGFDEMVEDAGGQRLAAYYLYCALLAGVVSDGQELRTLYAQADGELAYQRAGRSR